MRSSVRLLFCFLASQPAVLVNSRAAGTLDFNRDVQPILAGHCMECHGPDAAGRKGKLRLDRGDSLAEDRGGYRILVPGKPEASELIARITHADPEERMPPADFGKKEPLKPEEIEILKRWIAEGAEFAGHWAFTPPQRPPLPKVSNENWPKNDIDRFVLNRLDAEGLKPTPEAEKTRLIRRAALALN